MSAGMMLPETHNAIAMAVARAREKHDAPHEIAAYAIRNKDKLVAILNEEVLEFCHALYCESSERANDELLDIMAVAVRILEGR